jgi:branched-chain amino acid transport system substrate-binding protein
LPGNAAPVVKVGVIAPFEGAGRPLGYAVLPAIKAVVAEANASGDLGAVRVAVVAFNDSLDPATAAEQAEALALDGDVIAVIGPFSESTATAARPALEAAGLRFEPVISEDPLAADYSDEIAAAEDATRRAIKPLISRLNSD